MYMYQISIFVFFFLLFISPVSGDFEEIRKRQYEPAIRVQKTINIIWNGVLEGNYDVIFEQLMYIKFLFIDDTNVRRDANHFINNFLFKKLNLSIPPETYDVHNRSRTGAQIEGGRRVTYNMDIIQASVQWGGFYLCLQFNQIKEYRDYFTLGVVQVFPKRQRIRIPEIDNFAMKLTKKLIKNEPILAPGFVYKTCTNQTIINAQKIIAKYFKNPKTFQVADAIYFSWTRHTYYSCWGLFSCDEEHYDKYVQAEIVGFNGRRHLFEFDWKKGKVLRGMEYSCEEQNKWEAIKNQYFKEYQ